MTYVFPQKQVRAVIDYVWDNPYSTFYNNFWNQHGISEKPIVQKLHDLEILPLLHKSDLAAVVDPTLRYYGAPGTIDTLTNTSGTSGDAPLFFWYTVPRHTTRLVPYQKTAPTILLSFNLNKFLTHAIRARYAGMQALLGDVHDLKYSARIARIASVNTLCITPTLALLFAPYLNDEQCIQNITVIVLWGEYCSDATYTKLQETYPQAHFILEYASTEANHIAWSTSTCSKPNTTKHVDTQAHYLEIVSGEIVLTSLETDRSNPLIRYQTGDGARFLTEPCACGNTEPRIELLGRIDGETVRVAGGELRIEEVDRVMFGIEAYIEPDYFIEVGEVEHNQKIVASITVHVRKKPLAWLDDRTIHEQVVAAFMNDFRLSTNMFLRDAIEAKLVMPLRVTLESKPLQKEKHKRIIRTA